MIFVFLDAIVSLSHVLHTSYFFLLEAQVIRNLLGDDADMLSLYLTHPDRQDGEQVRKQKELVFA